MKSSEGVRPLPFPFLPAVYADGGICLDILQNQWSPIYDVSAILTSIQVRGLSRSPLSRVPRNAPCSSPFVPTARNPLRIPDPPLPPRPCATQSLLCDPNPNSPANSEAARMYSESRREYNKRVEEVVAASWTTT